MDAYSREIGRERLERCTERTRERGANPLVYYLVRLLFVPFFKVYFRLELIGREHVPRRGPVILASNHRSFLDPFVIGVLQRRPVYYMAKKELFGHPAAAWFLNCLGAFPIDRGSGDEGAMAAARRVLARGDAVVIFPEGTRVRPGPLADPKRGVGRLALETGASVVPIAVIGTEAVRRGWRIRPHHVRIRVGSPMRFPSTEQPSKQAASAVTRRIWACVSLQWEWLGGIQPPGRSRVSAPALGGPDGSTDELEPAEALVGSERAA
ncbi:MAG TPA: lysophospholipid acyltransferase family protein [Solirubrobacteraceae bacterium]|jgi:1-acyl-sn-glycerol-3-phosphate acyltransferase|nr:lysophospholipid acyltransferase family protein [Solirubrobacteraceae bacterium]